VVSESEHLPQGKSETEVAIETFVDRIEEIYPNLDREQFQDAISRCTQENVPDEAGDEEE
jgi:ferritin-like protein